MQVFHPGGGGGGGGPDLSGLAFVTHEAEAGLPSSRVLWTPASGAKALGKLEIGASDFSQTSQVTPQNTPIAFAVEASARYLIDLVLPFTAGGSGGLRFDWTLPTSPAASYHTVRSNTTGNLQSYDGQTVAGIGGQADMVTAIAGTSGVAGIAHVMAILVNGANAGTVTLRFAQSSSNATASVLKAGGGGYYVRLS